MGGGGGEGGGRGGSMLLRQMRWEKEYGGETEIWLWKLGRKMLGERDDGWEVRE